MICEECGNNMDNGFCPSCGFDQLKQNNKKITLSESELKLLTKRRDTFSKSLVKYYYVHHYLTQKQYWYVLHPKTTSNPRLIWYFVIGNYLLTIIGIIGLILTE